MKAVFVALLVATVVGTVRGADEPPLPEVATALGRIADESTIELTTTGRTTGHEHTKPVWFVVMDGRIVRLVKQACCNGSCTVSRGSKNCLSSFARRCETRSASP